MWRRIEKQDQTISPSNLAADSSFDEGSSGKGTLPLASSSSPEEPDRALHSPRRGARQAVSSIWKMGLVVTASAFCGGIAVVLWNRRLLTKMREVAPMAHPAYLEQQGRLWEDDL